MPRDPPLPLTAKRSQTQRARQEDASLLWGRQHYRKPGHPYHSSLYLPPLQCKVCMSHSHRLRARTLIYLHSISNKVKSPRPSTQLQLFLEHLTQCSQDSWRPMAGCEAILGKPPGHGDRQTLCHSVIHQLSATNSISSITIYYD